MQTIIALIILVAPVLFVLGLIKPSLFAKLLGDQAKRSSIAALSIALFFGSSMAWGVLYPEQPVVEQNETVAIPTPEETSPLTVLPKEDPKITIPKGTDPERTPSLEIPTTEPEPQPVDPTPELAPTPTPVLEPTPAPTPAPSTPTYDCSYDKYNCGDFNNCSEVMSVFNYCGSSDINGLDGDNDGVPCEKLCK